IGITAAPFGLSDNVSLAVTGDNGTFILVGNGDGTFRPRGSYAPAGIEVTSGDLDRDGRSDLVVVSGSGYIALLFGKSDGNFRAAHDFVTGFGPTDATVADVNEDGKPDLVIPNVDNETISVLLGDTGNRFRDGVQSFAGVAPSNVCAGDLNGDGHLDLVVTNDT